MLKNTARKSYFCTPKPENMPNTIDFAPQIAQELSLAAHHVANVIRLFDEGATIPFIARYRKEMTGTMNEENVAAVQKRLEQLVELQKRKARPAGC